MARGWILIVQFFRSLAEPTGKNASNVVNGGETFAETLHLIGQPFVRHMHVREERVAATFRHLARKQDRSERWFFAPGDIGMPGIFLTAALGSVFDPQHFGIGLVLRRRRVDFEFSKVARKSDMLRRGEILIAEEDDTMFEKGRPDLRYPITDIRRPQVDAQNFGPNGRRHRPDVERAGIELRAVEGSCHLSLSSRRSMPQGEENWLEGHASTNLRALSRRCGQPGQQHGRFFPSRISSCSRSRRFSRVASCLADRVQQIHSFLASGVSASHFADSEASPSSIALSSGVSWWRKSGSAAFATPLQAALASSISIRSQISTRADTRSSIMAGVCAGPGVKRSRSVPRGTVGKLIGCT